ncbi:microsomal glutathione S-transferase 1-like [Ochlerotatus camptorhynchus]|uniref:microsomal glutathione S-transferase 1-like n=1 Tax=Ochlerotatus camptorhynchus TaxID=644619 RepID=UPI0031D42461
MTNILDQMDPELFRTYAFWSVILVLKMVLMTLLTTLNRFRKMAFCNPEDTASISRKLKPKFDDPDVERVRRAHRNDLENILPFFVVAFLYLLTNPDPWLATNLIRAAVIGRIVHSLVYAVLPLPQPARFLSFGVMMLVTLFMIFKCIIYFI